MGCKPSKSRIYIAPLQDGEDDTQEPVQDPGFAEGNSSETGSPCRGNGIEQERPADRRPNPIPTRTSSETTTKMLAMRQLSISAQLPHERRLLASFPSRQQIVLLPTRIRRFSIAAESYETTAALARIHSGSGAHDDGHPYYAKTDEEKTFILTAVSKSFLFEGLQAEDLAVIVDAMHPVEIEAQKPVFHQGDAGTEFYIIESGRVDVVVDGSVVNHLGAESHFGELALMHNCPRNATVKATTDCKLWALDRRTFRTVVVSSAASLMQEKANFIKSLDFLSTMSVRQHYRLAEASSFSDFKAGDMIIEQDAPGMFFYIIRSGEVSVLKRIQRPEDGKVVCEQVDVLRLGPGQYFGEQALLHNHKRLASVRAETAVQCLCLHKDFFLQMFMDLTSSMDVNHSKREEREETVRAGRAVMKAVDDALPPLHVRTESPMRTFEPDTSPVVDMSDVPLSALVPVAILGEGAFGTVRLVRHEASGSLFALKIMQKVRLVEMSQQRNVIMEKNIMQRANHPYILKLYRTYQDQNCLYMLLEFCQGGDMFALLGRQGGKIDSLMARHYAACVASVFEYLHARSVAYRDLKPENLVFDSAGHLKVVDFGFAKIIRDRTYTLCGTPEYLSPELVQGSGHHHGVDCWALGILIFEMLCGYSPFADREHNNQLVIYRNIISGRYTFPAFVTDEAAKDVIRRFLVPKDSKRLGCMKGGFKDVREHPWFYDFDWDALMAKRLPPPCVPSFSSPTDLSLFDELTEANVGKIVAFNGDSSEWESEF